MADEVRNENRGFKKEVVARWGLLNQLCHPLKCAI